MAIGDLLFSLMGQPDPRRQLATALNPVPVNGPAPSNNPGQAGGGLANFPQGGPGAPSQLPGADPATAPPQQQQQQSAPPQPQAYTSPPDLGKMYMDLMNRQQANEEINRGAGLLFGAFAAPADRGPMLQAMTGQSGAPSSPGDMMENIGKIYQMQQGMAMQRQMLANAPVYAKQLNIPVEQVYALIAQGKLPEIMQDAEKQRLLQADPLHQAQTASAQAEVPLKQAQTGSAQAEIPLKQAQTGEEQAKIPLTQAQTAEATATAAKTQQEIDARTKLLQSVPTIAKQTGMDEATLGALPPDKLAEVASKAIEPTEASKNFAQTRAELAKQGYSADQINSLAPPEVLIAGASADPMWRSYIIQRGAALKADPNSQAATQSFEQFKSAATAQQSGATKAAELSAEDKAKAIAGIPGEELKIREAMDLADKITADPNLGNRTGILSHVPALWGNEATTQANIDKLSGTSGVAAVDALKGGVGRILGSEFSESEKSQSLLSHQNIPTSDYKDAVVDFKKKLGTQMVQMYQKAGLPVPDYYRPYVAEASPPSAATPKRRTYNAQGELQ